MIRRPIMMSCFVCLLMQPVLAGPIDPSNPPEGRFSDQWAEIYLSGKKVGYAHTTMTRHGGLIRTGTTMHLRIDRAGQPIEVSVTRSALETLAGAPISFESETNMASVVMLQKGTISEGKVTIESSQFGMVKSQTFPYPKGAVLTTWGCFRESLLRGFKPGTEYTLDVYEPDFRLDDAVKAITKIGQREEFVHHGKTMRGPKVTVIIESPIGTLRTESWLDDSGEPLRARVPLAGFDLELITTDQASALSDFLAPEIFMANVIETKIKIDPQSVDRITYRLKAKTNEADLSDLPDSGMQRVAAQADRSVDLIVTRQTHKPVPTAAGPRSVPKDLSEYLDANLVINTADPELIELAKRAAGGETGPFVLADRLRRFVTDYVADKNLNIGFATASEVCRTREGDCSEHAVLLAALGRLNGLPARVVAGVAYVGNYGGRSGVFGYHMWTQFLIDGRWIDVDAALRETVCSPTRIALAASSLRNAGLADLSFPLVSVIGAIDIEVIEIDGRRIERD